MKLLFLLVLSHFALCGLCFTTTQLTIQIHEELQWSFSPNNYGKWPVRQKERNRVSAKGGRPWQPLCTTVILKIFSIPLSSAVISRVGLCDESNMEIRPPPTFCTTCRSLSVTYFPYIADSWSTHPPSKVALLWGVSFHGLTHTHSELRNLLKKKNPDSLNKAGDKPVTVALDVSLSLTLTVLFSLDLDLHTANKTNCKTTVWSKTNSKVSRHYVSAVRK